MHYESWLILELLVSNICIPKYRPLSGIGLEKLEEDGVRLKKSKYHYQQNSYLGRIQNIQQGYLANRRQSLHHC